MVQNPLLLYAEFPLVFLNAGREATCLADYGAKVGDEERFEIAKRISGKVIGWSNGNDEAAVVLKEWKQMVEWSETFELREEYNAKNPTYKHRKKVKAIGINDFGNLKVRDVITGEESLLAAEYLL